MIDLEAQLALERKVQVLEAEAAQLRSALPSRSATSLADELKRLLIRAADSAEELATLGLPSAAVDQLNRRLADVFVWAFHGARGISSYSRRGQA